MKNHKMLTGCICALCLFFVSIMQAENNKAMREPSFKAGSTTPEIPLQATPLGATLPQGWILQQMKQDMTTGFYSNFGNYASMVNNNLFGDVKKRTGGRWYPKKVGTEKRMSRAWWSGEQEGYWKDGMVRLAFLTGDKEWIARAREWVNSILKYASGKEGNGYIGIYTTEDKPGGRYNHERNLKKPLDNGELWTQSRIMVMLLAYYGFTGDKKVLDAVEKAVDLTMSKADKVDFFGPEIPKSCGGIAHGVGFFEILKDLYCMTGDAKYAKYFMELYRQYNLAKIEHPSDGVQIKNLLDLNKKLRDHTPHFAEAVFAPYFYAMITGRNQDKILNTNLLKKIDYHTAPSGAMLGSENISYRPGNATDGYEQCAQMELMSSLTSIIQLSGDITIADRLEKLMFNAIEGAWLPDKKGILYLASDNAYEHNPEAHGGRYHYSSCHKAACCCTLCSGRALPYYTEAMWMKKTPSTLIALMYGPNILNTEINGTKVRIEEKTTYPFSNSIQFRITSEKPVSFTLRLRKPFGVPVTVSGAKIAKDMTNYIEIEKVWENGDSVDVLFDFKPQIKKGRINTRTYGVYFQYGPLVFALPLKSKTTLVKDFGGGFGDFRTERLDNTGWDYKVDKNEPVTLEKGKIKPGQNPWITPPLKLKTRLVNQDGQYVETELIPMGAADLRRVVFPEYTKK